MKIKLIPSKGIEYEGNVIELGADINSTNIKSIAEKYDNVYSLFDSNIQIETDGNAICSIMCCIGKDSDLELIYKDWCVSDLDVESFIELFNEQLCEDAIEEEEEHTYIWKSHNLSCWRERTPKSVEELITESKIDGVYEEMKEEIAKDIEMSRYFATICIEKIFT